MPTPTIIDPQIKDPNLILATTPPPPETPLKDSLIVKPPEVTHRFTPSSVTIPHPPVRFPPTQYDETLTLIP